MSHSRWYTVEVLEPAGSGRLSTVELITDVPVEVGRFELRKHEAHQAIIEVVSGRIYSNYGQNHTRYGYRAYEAGKAGLHPDQEFLIRRKEWGPA